MPMVLTTDGMTNEQVTFVVYQEPKVVTFEATIDWNCGEFTYTLEPNLAPIIIMDTDTKTITFSSQEESDIDTYSLAS